MLQNDDNDAHDRPEGNDDRDDDEYDTMIMTMMSAM